MKKETTAEKRNYKVRSTQEAKQILINFLESVDFPLDKISYGLPEVHDRYHEWKVPVLYNNEIIGAFSIDAYNSTVVEKKSSKISVLKSRKKKIKERLNSTTAKKKRANFEYIVSELENTIALGRSEEVLQKLPEQSIDLVFTSPPYFNARKEYSEYDSYEDYLDFMREVIKQCKRVLIDGKFFVINSSHVLVPRTSRQESSTRIPVPFDLHQIFMEEGFEFIDDIIWKKPEGAGWASGRGRRFSADRNPMQYKAVPVTEYVMVYRKKPAPLIDNFIRKHPNQELVSQSKVEDGYEVTNVWYLSPARDKRHPAIFPAELAEKVIKYYSFKKDIVLDPFAGIATTAKAANKLDRRFYMIEASREYVEEILNDPIFDRDTIFKNIDYEYIDYSNLEGPNSYSKSIRHIVSDLLETGLTEEEIKQKLLR
ncbi:DNA-methyltransferase [Aerococcus urinaeequi]|uniref:DNA-methyltransferase n=1 Tax=Aerococcus urinaeequi TaxID=51665 RepID=UPI003EDA3076